MEIESVLQVGDKIRISTWLGSYIVKITRGTKKGLQALQGTELRSKYPPELCNHIVDICEKYIDLEPLPAKFGKHIIQKDLFDF